ncbi:Fe-S biogenesis protein NfuA [Pseudoteredinibacter isoporae]|uniref:Fe/S biogenesis protein NfuA n=1 Tax=Pseudoteredinibacter isoporae TaxID=570281 RepID=A0A7X0JUB2_9GAMM|nr:Fe-S biogenesis protein NfuA [Pseudoteredinibacter isoporae]MBB6521531.1 Fe/S biogenesis protein NfuA [Pseudoteredinibacter isoporae]NHO87085.1 Fe-S biogenesis protein NfuA [Pseudoteredinibacter isoporae]NIB22832.1 Fe-S biogenesis protein NfuA [Pseudoteredinibacter isoporae]
MSDTPVVDVDFTPSAQSYLAELLSKQDCEGIGIRMFVSNPGTPQAETCIAYCRPGEEQEGDIPVPLEGFTAHFEGRSIPFLAEAKVDYSADKMGGQLTIRAPNSKMPNVSDDSPLEDKINYILYNDINPGLASHGGEVSLVELTEDKYAVLRFGGGCQGCASVDMTLKDGVEATLKDKLPELAGVRDITDHSDRSQAYY